MSSTTPASVRFKDHDHGHITTVRGLQNTLQEAGFNPYDYIVWKEERDLVALFGVYVVSPTEDGSFNLDILDRGSVNHRGTYPTEAGVVRAFLAETDPQPPPDQARVRAASQRAHVDNMAKHKRMEEEDRQMIARVMRERAEAGLPLDPTAE